jgi:hypothetical protein
MEKDVLWFYFMCLKNQNWKLIRESDNRSTRVLATQLPLPTYPAYMVTIYISYVLTYDNYSFTWVNVRWK